MPGIGDLEHFNVPRRILGHDPSTVFHGQILLVPDLNRLHFALIAARKLLDETAEVGRVGRQSVVVFATGQEIGDFVTLRSSFCPCCAALSTI